MNPFCVNCKANFGDGHDCDNCAYCGTDTASEEIKEAISERKNATPLQMS